MLPVVSIPDGAHVILHTRKQQVPIPVILEKHHRPLVAKVSCLSYKLTQRRIEQQSNLNLILLQMRLSELRHNRKQEKIITFQTVCCTFHADDNANGFHIGYGSTMFLQCYSKLAPSMTMQRPLSQRGGIYFGYSLLRVTNCKQPVLIHAHL